MHRLSLNEDFCDITHFLHSFAEKFSDIIQHKDILQTILF